MLAHCLEGQNTEVGRFSASTFDESNLKDPDQQGKGFFAEHCALMFWNRLLFQACIVQEVFSFVDDFHCYFIAFSAGKRRAHARPLLVWCLVTVVIWWLVCWTWSSFRKSKPTSFLNPVQELSTNDMNITNPPKSKVGSNCFVTMPTTQAHRCHIQYLSVWWFADRSCQH